MIATDAISLLITANRAVEIISGLIPSGTLRTCYGKRGALKLNASYTRGCEQRYDQTMHLLQNAFPFSGHAENWTLSTALRQVPVPSRCHGTLGTQRFRYHRGRKRGHNNNLDTRRQDGHVRYPFRTVGCTVTQWIRPPDHSFEALPHDGAMQIICKGQQP